MFVLIHMACHGNTKGMVGPFDTNHAAWKHRDTLGKTVSTEYYYVMPVGEPQQSIEARMLQHSGDLFEGTTRELLVEGANVIEKLRGVKT